LDKQSNTIVVPNSVLKYFGLGTFIAKNSRILILGDAVKSHNWYRPVDRDANSIVVYLILVDLHPSSFNQEYAFRHAVINVIGNDHVFLRVLASYGNLSFDIFE